MRNCSVTFIKTHYCVPAYPRERLIVLVLKASGGDRRILLLLLRRSRGLHKSEIPKR